MQSHESMIEYPKFLEHMSFKIIVQNKYTALQVKIRLSLRIKVVGLNINMFV